MIGTGQNKTYGIDEFANADPIRDLVMNRNSHYFTDRDETHGNLQIMTRYTVGELSKNK